MLFRWSRLGAKRRRRSRRLPRRRSVWLALFFFVPMAVIWAYSFGENVGPDTTIDFTGTFANYARALEPLYLASIFVEKPDRRRRSRRCCASSSAFPVALAIAFASPKTKAWLLLLIMLPFWTNLAHPHVRADRCAARERLCELHARMALEQCQRADDARGAAAARRV